MAKLRFRIDKAQASKKIKSRDWIAIEKWMYEGDLNLGALHNVAALFMVNEKDEPIPEADARRILGEMSLAENKEIAIALFGGFKDIAVPPASGSSS